ncbi:hypothetical protein HDF16_002147 [Granulicella aggregans]|uniref:Uncharacterized protein n=1 Tax=Granulicella aggregans TaxID=474949 RepID=A0A7W7ZCL3_9BACT|nr:hypothetical protein [Granulicella aggregans]
MSVLRDGKMYYDNVEIPGPTGGALDSNESEPGPFYLQGDHHRLSQNNDLCPARVTMPSLTDDALPSVLSGLLAGFRR